MGCQRARLVGCFVLFLAVFAAANAGAQTIEDLRDSARDQLQREGALAQLLALNNFAALPDISASQFSVDNQNDGTGFTIETYKLPGDVVTEIAGFPVYLEGNLGLSYARQNVDLRPLVNFDQDFFAFSALGGIGPEIDFPIEGLAFRPVALFGYN